MKSKLFGLAKAGFESASYREMSEHSINDIIEILDWALNGSFCDPGPAFQDMEFITDTFGIRKMIGVDSVNSNELEAVFENIALWAGTAYYNIQHQDKKTILFTLDMLSGSPHFDSIYIEVSFLMGYNQLDSTDFGYPYSLSCIDCCDNPDWDATDELQRDLRLERQERVQLPFFFTDHYHVCFSPQPTCSGTKLSGLSNFNEIFWGQDIENADQTTISRYPFLLFEGITIDCLEEDDMDFYFNSMVYLIDDKNPHKKVPSAIYVGWEAILGDPALAFHIMHVMYSEIRERVVPYEEYFDFDLSDGPYPLPY